MGFEPKRKDVSQKQKQTKKKKKEEEEDMSVK